MLEAIRYLKPYLGRYKVKYLAGVVFLLLTNSFRIANPRVIQNAIDYLKEQFSLEQLSIYALLVVGIAIGEGLFSFLMRRSMIVASREIENDLRNDFFSSLSKQPQAFYHQYATGDIMSRATNDLSAVRMLLGPGIAYSTNTVFAFLFVIPMMLLINPWLTLWALVPIPLVALLVNRFGKAIYKRFERIQAQLSTLSSRAQENLSGQTMVKWFAREKYEVERFETENHEYMNRYIDYAKVYAAFHPSLMLTVGISTVVILWIGGHQVMGESISLGQFTAFLLYMGILVWPSIALGWVIGIFQQGAASLKRMREVLDADAGIHDAPDALAVDSLAGDIRFNQLNFGYSRDMVVLKDVNLEISARQTIGIIGPTGCGKSTLIKLLTRMYQLPDGMLFIDDVDINRYRMADLRRRISYVPQETFLFSDSIRSNIAYGMPNASQAEIEKAARLADIHDQIMDFANGYDSMLGEKGLNLSGGQKQRVSIARAILRDPDILILDDAFSALDTRTEDRILKNLAEIFPDRSVILVSHRVSTLQNADKIFVMEAGGIVEEGSHDTLIGNKGLYAWIHERQLLEAELARTE